VSNGPYGSTLRQMHALFNEGTVGGLTDAELLQRFTARAGEDAESAFSVLIDRHGPMVMRVCRRVLRDTQDIDDAFQATFLVLVRKAGRLTIKDSLGPWLHGVALRAASCARSTAARRRMHERRAAEMRAESTVDGIPDDLGKILHDEIHRLPERYRAPIVLCCLEGLTQGQAALSLGWPVGTVQSGLARGRDRLRDRLRRRGVAPSVLLAGLVPSEIPAGAIGAAGAVLRMAANGRSIAGVVPATTATLVGKVMRSMMMTKLKWVAAPLLAASGVAMGASWNFQPRTVATPPPAIVQEPARPAGGIQAAADDDPGNDKERKKDYLIATIGSSLKTGDGRIMNREAILYKDGTVKLWSFDAHAPIGEPLRHKGPIRNLAFLDEANLLVTTSDDSMKLWDAASGTPKGEIEGPPNPLLHYCYSAKTGRFVTIEPGRRAVSLRDASTFKSLSSFRCDGPPAFGAALTEDGATLVTFREDRAVELRDLATSQVFATLGPPSVVADVVRPDRSIDHSKLDRNGGRFWEIVPLLEPRRSRPQQ
jgi:RNA polymerase sigma factor (sigma-70 family)